jgi:hypothetical protein
VKHVCDGKIQNDACGDNKMKPIIVYLETGQKRTIAGAVDWPGWCRIRLDEPTALQTLIDYGPRYAQVLRPGGIDFQAPADRSAFVVIERLVGNTSTDFGVPAIMLGSDHDAVDPAEHERMRTLLLACWQAFDRAAQSAAGKNLRKGPRGGGRDTRQIVQHVLDAEQAYLKSEGEQNSEQALRDRQQASLSALEASVKGELPKQGPRGGVIWPARYYVRRSAWHILDHAWEIEDRVE